MKSDRPRGRSGYSCQVGSEDEAPEPEDVVAERRGQVRTEDESPEWRRGLIGASAEQGRGIVQPALATHGESWRERHWTSRALHRLGEVSAHAAAGLAAAVGVLVWLAVGLTTDFPEWWETALYATSSSVTLVMVFAIQHTQTRQQSATQRKLDELLRAQPEADNTVIAVEEAPDQELEARANLNLADRQEVAEMGEATKD
jgi:low affinity Fe/Cu permease